MSKLNAQKLKVTPTKIILNSSLNMKNTKSKKYGFLPEEIESKSLSNEKFRTMFNMRRIEKTRLAYGRLDRYDKKRYSAKKLKLRENLTIGEKVLVLAEQIRKKSAPRKFYKQSVQNISYFNKTETFVIRKKQKNDNIQYYWVKNAQNNKKLSKNFQRTELFAFRNNFVM